MECLTTGAGQQVDARNKPEHAEFHSEWTLSFNLGKCLATIGRSILGLTNGKIPATTAGRSAYHNMEKI